MIPQSFNLKRLFKLSKRSIQKYNNDTWNKPEQINKEFTDDLKQWKVDAYQLVTTVHNHRNNKNSSKSMFRTLCTTPSLATAVKLHFI